MALLRQALFIRIISELRKNLPNQGKYLLGTTINREKRKTEKISDSPPGPGTFEKTKNEVKMPQQIMLDQ